MYYEEEYESPLGKLRLIGSADAILGLYPAGEGPKIPLSEIYAGKSGILRAAAEWLDAYFAGERPDIGMLPLRPEGTEFQKLIWRLLCGIPCGKVTSYGQIAREAAEIMGRERMSAQAVGNAVGRNPISIIIPCHRVLGSKGELTGYRWGPDMKLFLLKHEGADISKLRVPKTGRAGGR
ncbi:MAG: methylated-DNA--[protein]-cysteine S-methyltransferase [Candidatus Limivicinus sp.]|jgi:methylated-DNA-[protein]-cysteine S-methyltransferase